MKRTYAETCDCEPGKALGDGVYRVMPIYLTDEEEATRLWIAYRKTWEPALSGTGPPPDKIRYFAVHYRGKHLLMVRE